MHPKRNQGVGGSVAEDEGAGGDGLGAVCVVAGADGGGGQLQGSSVHQVSHKKQVVELIGGVAGRAFTIQVPLYHPLTPNPHANPAQAEEAG